MNGRKTVFHDLGVEKVRNQKPVQDRHSQQVVIARAWVFAGEQYRLVPRV